MTTKDPQECIDLKCAHFDGDMCLVAGLDCPPETADESRESGDENVSADDAGEPGKHIDEEWAEVLGQLDELAARMDLREALREAGPVGGACMQFNALMDKFAQEPEENFDTMFYVTSFIPKALLVIAEQLEETNKHLKAQGQIVDELTLMNTHLSVSVEAASKVDQNLRDIHAALQALGR